MRRLGRCPEAYAALVDAEVRYRLAVRDRHDVDQAAAELAALPAEEFAARVAGAYSAGSTPAARQI